MNNFYSNVLGKYARDIDDILDNPYSGFSSTKISNRPIRPISLDDNGETKDIFNVKKFPISVYKDKNKGYIVYVILQGLEKEDFTIKVSNNLLTIKIRRVI